MVASIDPCSMTVSDAWPSVRPASFSIAGTLYLPVPHAALMQAVSVSTPNSWAMSTTFTPLTPATTCHRSVKAVLIDSAMAFCGAYGPFSYRASLWTRYPPLPGVLAG